MVVVTLIMMMVMIIIGEIYELNMYDREEGGRASDCCRYIQSHEGGIYRGTGD